MAGVGPEGRWWPILSHKNPATAENSIAPKMFSSLSLENVQSLTVQIRWDARSDYLRAAVRIRADQILGRMAQVFRVMW